MIQMVFLYCKADLLPIEESPIFREVILEAGPEVAQELVYEVVDPPDESLGYAD
ncbi:hypothetical protein [Gorillibacterium sp. sgz5001074]|uniref:hypothetical protein n=1 Tax=Gorillibacterium sp. sgz5001074 TaxID=3446695 RepID=UPI003F66A499